MSARFRLPSAKSYNVRASELERERSHAQAVCNVLLTWTTVCIAFKVNKADPGQVLLDLVFKHLELTERDYFGLHLSDESSDAPRWLDPNKPIRKQLKRGSPHSLSFRVKFFVSDPSKLQEEYTRYQYFLQIKQDILTGRLPCPHNTAALLASYAVQSELGDYSEQEHPIGEYLSDFSFIPNPPQDFHREVCKHHQQHSGLTPAQAEFQYLNTARTLDLYGVELHWARDQSQTEILLGVQSGGILVYKNRVRINYFPWLKIVKISFKCKQFFIQLRREVSESRETLLGFHMGNYRSCKNLWKACVEHHTFFRLERPLPPHKNFFSHYFTLGSKFRYCGRTEVQSVQYGKEKGIKDRVFARSPSKPLCRKLVSDWDSVSRNSLSEERLETQSLPNRSPPGTPNKNSLFVSEGTRVRPSSVGHLVDHVIHSSPSLPVFSSNHKSASSTQANSISLDSTPSPEGVAGQPPALPPKQLSRKTLSQIIQAHSQQSLYDEPGADSATLNGVVPHDNLVLIKMRPDEHGRFGFNVKGGADQKMPIIVSRVAPGTSADLCVPRLNEGDQVLLINGRDISDHTHDQVVMFIKASCESHSGELILLVRPNAIYNMVEEKDSEPEFQYIPEKSPIDSSVDQNALRESMSALREGLRQGALLQQFDALYRKRPGMTMLCAKLPQNVSKNRYRDISPYDATRVILKSTDDYINANYINMEIPAWSLINRYIACQGPLPHTCPDFWQMTWEQGSSLVVMLTTQVERGRVKCHQYWPNPESSAAYGDFNVTCHNEEGGAAFLVREMTIMHKPSGQQRELTQIQYLAWPDHGVPDDSTDFLDFVTLVRSKRSGQDQPVVVHCSAGIGRTGVLITMETALCLMECGQPVFPLDIVRTMRDQRAMMIQTPSQYRFVCEAILKVYDEGLVKPVHRPVQQREAERPLNDQSQSATSSLAACAEGEGPGERHLLELDEDDEGDVEVLDITEETEGETEDECLSVGSIGSRTSNQETSKRPQTSPEPGPDSDQTAEDPAETGYDPEKTSEDLNEGISNHKDAEETSTGLETSLESSPDLERSKDREENGKDPSKSGCDPGRTSQDSSKSSSDLDKSSSEPAKTSVDPDKTGPETEKSSLNPGNPSPDPENHDQDPDRTSAESESRTVEPQ
ncbi:tyrosine-protein phosphatase non-receptor type 4 [Periophthalmus magnuspinnatus]|uniref:tyrosine-protein phosphatase non-receptor type 4 n=1 Tax=Periophthalmus magnuspinnatus TaxID=409849 RepID=UPI00145ADFFF|nr:tyrosine-protein phosphatase non-receptor type 4 [Periophthalmus magnuspinnatus]